MGEGEGVAASVVIATRDQASFLDLTLVSLEHQLFPRGRWEVIVVDDASSDDTSAVLDSCERRGNVLLRHKRTGEPRGLSWARNQALEMARGKIILFLDDDQIVAPDWLVQHLRAHIREPAFVLGSSGRSLHTHLFSPMVELMKGVAPLRVMSAADLDVPHKWESLVQENGKDYSGIWNYFAAQNLAPPNSWVYFEGGNASVARELILSLGGFDEGYPSWNLGEWGLECNELALRVHQQNLPLRYEPKAVALRQIQPEPVFEWLDRAKNVNRFFALHPELDRARIEPLVCR
jgi:glycosyltransferase involved in cell wall biosynthesis